MPTNYTLTGIAGLFELGRGGPQLKNSSGLVQARDNTDTGFTEGQGSDATLDDSWVTLRQLNNATLGLSWHEPSRLASTANVDISNELEAGDSIDGVALVAGDRVLLKNQTDLIQNGIYIASASGAAARAPDMATGADATNAAMFVSEGSTLADTGWVQTLEPAIVGTDNQTYLQFASVTAGVTSITSVDNAGSFASLVKSGAAPVPEIRSISNGSQIAAVVATNEVALSIVANSVTNTEINSDTILEGNLATAVAVLYRQLAVAAADWPATPSATTVNIGDVLPTNAIVQNGVVMVTTAFDEDPDLEVGVAATADAVFETTDLNLLATDTYVSSRASVQSAQQLIATRTTVTTQPSVGAATIIVNFIRP